MIFATDLDRTIIYSPKFVNEENKNSVILIETLDGKEISYAFLGICIGRWEIGTIFRHTFISRFYFHVHSPGLL